MDIRFNLYAQSMGQKPCLEQLPRNIKSGKVGKLLQQQFLADRMKGAAVQAGYFMSVGGQMASHRRADVTTLSGLAIALQGGNPL